MDNTPLRRKPRLRNATALAAAQAGRGAAPAAAASAHRFGDVTMHAEVARVAERGPLPLRFGIADRAPAFAPSPNGELTPACDELPLWYVTPSLDLLERHEDERIVGVALVDLALEPYRSAAGIERGFAPLVDRFAASLHFAPGKHVLHLELSAEPTKDQLEGLARLRDYAQRRRRETGIETELRIAAPSGHPALRPPKP